MPKKFKFAKENEFFEPIKPSKNYIPEWYKNAEIFNYKKIKVDINNEVMKNFKNCIPFLDSFITGYSVEIPFDLIVTGGPNNKTISWAFNDIPFIKMRPDMLNKNIPIPYGHSDQHFIWKMMYDILLPKGYSAIFCHPMNRYDLPFTTMSGVVDADYGMSSGNMPFFIKNDFEGSIESGTPFIQIIPFKRDDWNIHEDISLIKLGSYNSFKSLSKNFGYYKDNFWKRKNFD